MNMIVSLMASGAKKRFSREEYRRIREEANTLFRALTEENKDLVLEVVNNTNMAIKYSKTCVVGDDVWIFYEYRLFGEDNLEEIIEHSMRLLQATFFLFHRKIEGDDSLPGEDDDDNDNENESKEDAA